MALYLFGGGVINDFAFAFLVGVVTGRFPPSTLPGPLCCGGTRASGPPLAGNWPSNPARRRPHRPDASLPCSRGCTPRPGIGGFILSVLFFLALDLGVFHRRAHVVRFREALAWTALWVTLSLCFRTVSRAHSHRELGPAGNRGVHHRLRHRVVPLDGQRVCHRAHLRLFPVPARYQHRVLFWGILGLWSCAA